MGSAERHVRFLQERLGILFGALLREEALDNIRAAIADILARITVATVEVEASPTRLSDHPWAKFSGMWKDDLTFDDCKRSPLKTRSDIASSAATKPSHAP